MDEYVPAEDVGEDAGIVVEVYQHWLVLWSSQTWKKHQSPDKADQNTTKLPNTLYTDKHFQ